MSADRITTTEVLRALLAKSGAAAESVTLKLNAKGETQPEVVAVVREGETLEDAGRRALEVYGALLRVSWPKPHEAPE